MATDSFVCFHRFHVSASRQRHGLRSGAVLETHGRSASMCDLPRQSAQASFLLVALRNGCIALRIRGGSVQPFHLMTLHLLRRHVGDFHGHAYVDLLRRMAVEQNLAGIPSRCAFVVDREVHRYLISILTLIFLFAKSFIQSCMF